MDIKVPDIGDFSDVPVVSILVSVGDTIAEEDPLIELESDKATMEVPSPAAGKIKEIKLSEGEVEVRTIKEHRFLVVFRADGLSDDVGGTEPHQVGLKPLDPKPTSEGAEKTARLAKEFVAKARDVLSGHEPANMALLRGFAELPGWPSFEEVYGTRAACIADYPMYRGLGRLLGMTALEGGSEPETKFDALKSHWDDYDFFFVHVKKPDKAGEDGEFDTKLESIEHVDRALPQLLDIAPDVLVVTGDHSTPWSLSNHGWQPVPGPPSSWCSGCCRLSGPSPAASGERASASAGCRTWSCSEEAPTDASPPAGEVWGGKRA